MLTVYGADWCEDTRRSLRHLRRLGVAHRYLNIDEDLDALDRAKALNGGERRTPIIDLGIGGRALIEPDNDTLAGALVELEMLTQDDAYDRMAVQNVGDVERVIRGGAGLVLIAAAAAAPRGLKGLLRITGAGVTLSGLTGWCPADHYAGLTSLEGPGDRPGEALRRQWVAPRTDALLTETAR
jgi:glutaredoxin